MKIYVTPHSRKDSPANSTDYEIILQRDDWNDYSYITKYHLYLTKKLTGSDEIEYVGAVKIIKKGQVADYSYMVELGELSSLSSEYCSVGQSLDYYTRLSKLNNEVRNAILTSLRDINLFDYESEGFKDENVWTSSVMRDLKDDDDIFLLPKYILEHNFSSIPSIDIRFEFSHEKMLNSLKLDFDSEQYGFFNYQKLPCRMAVIVGRNGSGKSTTLARLSKVAFSSTQDRKKEIISSIGEIYPEGLGFPKIINLSYSAFDSFQIPGVTYKEKVQLKNDIAKGKGRYIYCGVRDVCAELEIELQQYSDTDIEDIYISSERQERTILKPLEVLSKEFNDAYVKIQQDDSKNKTLHSVLSKLKEEASISTIVDDILDDSFSENPEAYFYNLSTGHKFVLHSMLHIILYAEKRCFVFFDEPETHLHPPLLAVLMSAMRIILNKVDAFAIVATHSPVVVQETLSKNVNIITRSGSLIDFQRPEIETFGENIGSITSTVFSLTSQVTDYHDELDKLIKTYQAHDNAIELIESCFDQGLSLQARSYILSKLAIKVE